MLSMRSAEVQTALLTRSEIKSEICLLVVAELACAMHDPITGWQIPRYERMQGTPSSANVPGVASKLSWP